MEESQQLISRKIIVACSFSTRGADHFSFISQQSGALNDRVNPRILIIEDDALTSRALHEGLGASGYDCTACHSGEEGYKLLTKESFDAVVLDRMLPGRDGVEVVAALRRADIHVPVLMLTAMDEVAARVEGLDAGADDYLTKPFAFDELLARLRSLLRSRQPVAAKPLNLSVCGLKIDQIRRTARVGGEELILTPREFELLAWLARHAGRVVSRDELAREVWQETNRATPIDNVIDVHIARLRRKLEENGRPRVLHTLRGIGFKLAESESAT